MFEVGVEEGGMKRSEGVEMGGKRELERNFIEGVCWVYGREFFFFFLFGFERVGVFLIRCRLKEFIYCDFNN